MPRPVAQLVQDWLHHEDTHWEATMDVVAWAEGYGADLERAWRECPRADFLMAIAGAYQAPPDLVVRAACSAAREAMVLLPAKLALPRKAVHLAERYGAGGSLEGASPLADQTMALVHAYNARVASSRRLATEATHPAIEAISKAILAFLLEPSNRALLGRHAQVVSEGEVPGEVLAVVSKLRDQALEEKRVRRLRERTSAVYQALLEGHGARAACAVIVVAESANLEAKTSMLAAGMIANERATDKTLADLDKAARIARRSRARIYSEAALVFENAASAFACAAATGDEAWAAAITALFTVLMSAAGGAEIAPEQRHVHETTLLAGVERAQGDKLAEQARHVREVIPLSSLRRPEGEADRDATAERDARGALLDSLTVLAPLTRFLDEPEAAAAMDHCIAVLRATGPVDRKALSRSLHTMHERMRAMFEARARDAANDHAREGAQNAIVGAQAAMRDLEAALSKLGIDKPN